MYNSPREEKNHESDLDLHDLHTYLSLGQGFTTLDREGKWLRSRYSLLHVKEASEHDRKSFEIRIVFYSFLARARARMCSFLIYMISHRANEETQPLLLLFLTTYAYVKTGKVERETDNFDLLQ